MLKKIKEVNTFEDLENLGIGRVYCDISHRGGGIGFYSSDVASTFEVNEFDLPNKFGAGCNYLGGGIRGSIFPSGFSKAISKKKAAILNALANACARVYKNIEDQDNLKEEEEEDGGTNWDAAATNGARKAGLISAY